MVDRLIRTKTCRQIGIVVKYSFHVLGVIGSNPGKDLYILSKQKQVPDSIKLAELDDTIIDPFCGITGLRL